MFVLIILDWLMSFGTRIYLWKFARFSHPPYLRRSYFFILSEYFIKEWMIFLFSVCAFLFLIVHFESQHTKTSNQTRAKTKKKQLNSFSKIFSCLWLINLSQKRWITLTYTTRKFFLLGLSSAWWFWWNVIRWFWCFLLDVSIMIHFNLSCKEF